MLWCLLIDYDVNHGLNSFLAWLGNVKMEWNVFARGIFDICVAQYWVYSGVTIFLLQLYPKEQSHSLTSTHTYAINVLSHSLGPGLHYKWFYQLTNKTITHMLGNETAEQQSEQCGMTSRPIYSTSTCSHAQPQIKNTHPIQTHKEKIKPTTDSNTNQQSYISCIALYGTS